MTALNTNGAKVSMLGKTVLGAERELETAKHEFQEALALLLELGCPKGDLPRLMAARRLLLNGITRLVRLNGTH